MALKDENEVRTSQVFGGPLVGGDVRSFEAMLLTRHICQLEQQQYNKSPTSSATILTGPNYHIQRSTKAAAAFSAYTALEVLTDSPDIVVGSDIKPLASAKKSMPASCSIMMPTG